MQKKFDLLHSIYLEHLQSINGVKLTRREIDVIAFFICGRSAKKIASFFAISPKTVENHTHNIMLKLGCHSRESIIDFIERSDRLPFLRKYYATVLAEVAFEQCLKDISKLLQEENTSCYITYGSEKSSQDLLIYHLESSLKLLGVSVLTEVRNISRPLQAICKNHYVIYIMPKDPTENKEDLDALAKSTNRLLFLFPEGYDLREIFTDEKSVNLLNLTDQENYYLLIFDILKMLFPRYNFDGVYSEFNNQYEGVEGITDPNSQQIPIEELTKEIAEADFSRPVTSKFLSNKKYVLAGSLTILVLISSFVYVTGGQTSLQTFHTNKNLAGTVPIRSELLVPTDPVLLDRPEVIAQIEERFKGWRGIQAIALVGVGGAGKTTLAHYYASSQILPVIWAINAETKETLNESFEELAQALSRTEEDQKILRGILKAKIVTQQEENIVQFVKERLRLHSNWLLVYDNVEKFTDIQKHFPKDPGNWGQGRIILTTRDSNIGNSNRVNNVIQIKALSPEQKLNLFIKIMSNGGALSYTPEQTEEAKKFLVEIPPFPLDVSVAAYYLKATNISYKNYLDNMLKYNNDFSIVQEKILQETGDYTETRYGIITLSLKHLIETNKDFRDLLYFISVLDSQSIPREILVKFCNNIIVDNFIYHLKKYSLVANDFSSIDRLSSDISIHRSTQAIISAYLKQNLRPAESKSLLERVANTLENYMSDAIDKEDFTKMKLLYRHVEQFLNHQDLMSDNIKGSLGGELGCFFYYLRYLTKAKILLEDSLLKLQKKPDENHNKIAHFMVYLGNVHRNLGEYETAKKLFENSLRIYNTYSENDVGVARASGYLGVVYKALGDFSKARSLLERSLVIYRRYPENHIGRAWSLAHLGSVYLSLGDYEKAKELFEESRLLYKKYSENHVGAAWVSGDLGDTYLKLGDFKKAKEFIEECLKICNEHFVEGHVYVAEAFVHLGVLYREQGEYEKAKSLFKKSLIAFEANYGKDHPEVGTILKDLGQVYVLEGDFEGGEKIIGEAFRIFQKNKHPDKYIILESLAELYLKKSLRSEKQDNKLQAEEFKTLAKAYLSQAFEILETHFPEDSPHRQRIQSKLRTITSIL
ncbi:MAG: tetratricopeptide repeat protein [Proteobacteria bacterium]|nr:tetratricopeptide repeat protein [Pseudomonadota bacterium]